MKINKYSSIYLFLHIISIYFLTNRQVLKCPTFEDLASSSSVQLLLPNALMQHILPVPAVVFHNPLATPPPDDDALNNSLSPDSQLSVSVHPASVSDKANVNLHSDFSNTILDYATPPNQGIATLSSSSRFSRPSYDSSSAGGDRIQFDSAFGHSAEPSTSVTGTVSAKANGVCPI